jgi:hypothetical protein
MASMFAATTGVRTEPGRRPTVEDTTTRDAARRAITGSDGSERPDRVKNVQCSIESAPASSALSIASVAWR